VASHLRALSSAGTALLLLLSARIALAACENLCEVTLNAARIDPPLACAVIDAKPQTCDCAIAFRIDNACAVPLEATDFAFDLCWSPNEPSSSHVRNCTSVPVGKFGSLEIKLNDLGTHERRLHLQHEAVTHEITITSNVTSLGDDGCFCSVPGVRSDRALPSAAIAALFLGLAAAIRACRRRKHFRSA
jgi:hypothetical protein